MSAKMSLLNKLANEYDKTLRADDRRFGGFVHVVSIDDMGSFSYPNAFVVSRKDDQDSWYVVFTEHYGMHIYNADDVNVRQYSMTEIERAPF